MTTTTPAELTVDSEAGSGRRLSDAVRGLATRASAADAERVIKFVGPSLLCIGAIVILLGWYGAAHTTRVFLQIPYLISGGLFGLGLMFAGGFLYFSRWITDLLDETRRQAADAEASAARTADALERIEALLRDAFGDYEIELLESYDAEVDEGAGHSGMSALIDLVARKPA